MLVMPLKNLSTATPVSGQAMTELIVTAAVLVPLLLMLASFSNLLDLNTTALKASRFAAWERTAYSTNNSTSAELDKSIKKNIDRLILNRNWTDFGPGKALAGSPSMLKKTVVDGEDSYVAIRESTSKVAFADNGTPSRSADNVFKFDPEALSSSEISIPINGDYSLFKAVKMLNYRQVEYTNLDAPQNDINGAMEFSVGGSDALIANGWLPTDDDDFQSRVSKATVDGSTLGSFEQAAIFGSGAISWLGFQEMRSGMGDDGTSTVAGNQSEVLPDYDPVVP